MRREQAGLVGMRAPRRISAGLIIGTIASVLAGTGVAAQNALQPGEAYVTRFSGTVEQDGRTIIDTAGTVGIIIDIRTPGGPPQGEHWWNEPQRLPIAAGEVGQVFGVALDDALPPNVYLTATSAFGLHRAPDNGDWVAGQWGPDGGPGTVYRLSAADDYRPEVFARITLDGRLNTGASLGNIAFDRWNRQFYVSDLETGMIHRLRAGDGFDLGYFDHGVTGRANFHDAVAGVMQSLPPVAFDSLTAPRIADCPSGDFARTPSCWNLADFRRRVWGLGVRRDPLIGEVRLYYAVWGSQGFDDPGHALAGDDRRNAVWSVRITEDGDFDPTGVRREFFLPDLFRTPEAIARAGASHPVSDIAFPAFGDQEVMIVAERGGLRNLGLGAANAFAAPHEARVLRYEFDDRGVWQPVGRYDTGFYDRRDEGPPYIRAGSAGGVAFGMGYGEIWAIDFARPDAFLWVTGDGLCSPRGLCFDSSAGEHNDASEVHGAQGRIAAIFEEVEPEAAFRPYPAPGPATPADGPDAAFMIDTDINVDALGSGIEVELLRNDATRIGDVEIYQVAPDPGARPEEGTWYGPWEEDWPWPVPEGDYPLLPPPAPDEAWPELGIDKAPAACDPLGPCVVTVTVTNNGPGVYDGPVHILETPEGADLLATLSPGWVCEQPVSPGPIGCRSDWVTLRPGDSITLQLLIGGWMFAIPVPPPEFIELWNCSFVVWPGALEGPARIRAIEAALLLLGFDPGAVDGVYDAATQAAIDAYRVATGLPPGGIDDALFTSLFPAAAGMVGDGVPGNDWDCAPIRIPTGPIPFEPFEPEPGPEPGNIELHLEKELRSIECLPGGTCDFRITVSNEGSADYLGHVAFADFANLLGVGMLPDGAIESLTPGVTCGTVPGAGARCAHDDVLTIGRDGGFVHFEIRVDIPGGTAGRTLRNCGVIDWDDMDLPGVHDADSDNDFRCIDVDIAGEEEEPPVEPVPEDSLENVDLGLEKLGRTGECRPGGSCEFVVILTNHGTAPFRGPIVIGDYAGVIAVGPVPAASIRSLNPAWTCDPAIGSVARCRTVADMELGPEGGETRVAVAVALASDVDGDELSNCASIAWDPMAIPGGRDANPGNEDDCASKTIVHAEADLDPEHDTSCRRGESCTLRVRIRNSGDAQFEGSAGLVGTLSPAVPISAAEGVTPGLSCIITGDGAYQCSGSQLVIKAGDAARLELTAEIPADFSHDAITHTSDMMWPDPDVKDNNPDNDREVSTVTIEGPVVPTAQPGPDLSIDKTALQGSCVAGEACGFAVTIVNNGPGTFTGSLRADDVIAPSNARLASSGPAPWSCRTAGGRTGCIHPAVTLAPGESRSLSLAFATGTGSAGRVENCASLSWDAASRVFAVQAALNALGFDAGPADGKVGPMTRSAVRDYQTRVGMTASGRIDDTLMRRLFGSWGEGDVNAANDRDCAEAQLVAPEEPPAVIPPAVLPAPECDPGWYEVSSDVARSLAARGAPIRRVTGAYRTVFCTRRVPPPPEVCPAGWQEVGRDRAKVLAAERWQIRQAGNLLCARPPAAPPPQPQCTGGRGRNAAGQCVCPPARPVWTGQACLPRLVPAPRCPAGWTQFGRQEAKRLVQQGWEIQQVGDLLCARRRQVTPLTPSVTPGTTPSVTPTRCTGGQVRNKQGQCVCPPARPVWNGQLCLPRLQTGPTTVPPQQRVTPQQIIPQLQQLLRQR